MQDAIIKGTGNSRYLKSVSDFLTLYPTYEDMVQALVAGTLPIDLNGINTAGFSQLGTALNKANLLPDTTATSLGLSTDATVADALGVLADVGNIHVWKRDTTETGVTDYPTSTDRNAFGEGFVDSEVIPAHTTLGSLESVVVASGTATNTFSVNINAYTQVSVTASGDISGSGATSTVSATWNTYDNLANLRGKYFYINNSFYFATETASYSPKNANETGGYYELHILAQKVTGIAEETTGSAYLTYLGALGDKARIEVGSYVGTGTYGVNNASKFTFNNAPKYVLILPNVKDSISGYTAVPYRWGNTFALTSTTTDGYLYVNAIDVTISGETMTWYGSNASGQMNYSGTTYHVFGIE